MRIRHSTAPYGAPIVAILLAAGAATVHGAPDFVDVTGSANISFSGAYGPILGGITHFGEILMQRNMGEGAAVGDYDNDGDLDIYFLGQLGLSNQLLRNNHDTGSKTFTDVTAAAGVDDTGLGRMAHFVDLDNDGRLDLVVLNDDDGSGSYPASKIFRNDGNGTFTDVTVGSSFEPTGFLRCGAAIADYDQDGLLDIYVSVWSMLTPGTNDPSFPGANILYRNLGNFTFQDVSVSCGLGTLESNTFSSIFTDFDGNGEPDLFVARDGYADLFYWNIASVFTEDSAGVNVEHVANDMGVACADVDNDGDLDLYATNITDPIGQTYGFGQDNAFHINQEDTLATTVFVDEAVARGVEDTYWGWGVEFTDAENDGDLDIVAVNGFDEFLIDREGAGYPLVNTPSVLFVNDGTANYARQLGTGLDAGMDSRALIAFDYDRDGDEDLLITNVDQPAKLFENVSPSPGHWLEVQLRQAAGDNRNAIGATVSATIGTVTQRRDLICGDSYLAGTPAELHFGLGAQTAIDTLTVKWSNGSVNTFDDVSVDRMVTISNVPGDCNADLTTDLLDVSAFAEAMLGQPGAPLCLIDINNDGKKDGGDVQAFADLLLGQ